MWCHPPATGILTGSGDATALPDLRRVTTPNIGFRFLRPTLYRLQTTLKKTSPYRDSKVWRSLLSTQQMLVGGRYRVSRPCHSDRKKNNLTEVSW